MGRGQGNQLATTSLSRTRTDEIVAASLDDIVAINFKPGPKSPESADAFFITSVEFEKAQRSDDSVTALVESARRFYLATPNGLKLLEDTPWQAYDLKRLGPPFVKSNWQEIEQGRFDKEKLLSYDRYDLSLWKPDHDKPETRPYQLQLSSNDFDLAEAERILSRHPWILSVRETRAHTLDLVEASYKLLQGYGL